MSASIDAVLATLAKQFPCRDVQIKQLFHLLDGEFAPPVIVVHGLESTGKTSIIHGVLSAKSVSYALIDSRECITGRHLLERTLASCIEKSQSKLPGLDQALLIRSESINALSVQIKALIGDEQFFLVFDGIDKQREPPQTLLPALARLPELTPNLSVVFVVSQPRPGLVHRTGVPHVHFPKYERDEAITIVAQNPPPIFTEEWPVTSEDYTDRGHQEDSVWLWTRFCTALWDSIIKSTSADIGDFRKLAEKLWRPFVSSIVDGTFGTRDFSRLLLAKRSLFQDEEMLVDKVMAAPSRIDSRNDVKSNHFHTELSYYGKWLLCAAYLASYNPPRFDPVFFMKSTEKKRTTKKNVVVTVSQASKSRKIPRRLLAPAPFPLTRLIAIFNAILPHPVAMNADIYSQISTLTSVRLMIRGGLSADVLDPNAKWRVNVGWEMAQTLARSLGFEIGELLSE